jgi:outer membrane lipoprotein-sorting protein
MRTARLAGALVVVSLAVAPARGAGPPVDAKAILDRIDDLYRGASSHAQLSMKVVTTHWTRTLELEAWSKGKDDSLIRITAPAKERGTGTLKAGTNIWSYLPNVKRVVKVPSSMMSGSWMGSHFTNDDLVRDSRMSRDYDVSVDPGAPADRVVIAGVPKPSAPVVWGKVVATVRRSDLMPLSVAYYDEHGKLARTLAFSEVSKLGGREIPSVARMVPADKPGEMTEVHYQRLELGVALPDDMFSLRNLQR